MNILIFHNSILPVTTYGGTERMVWWLGRELRQQGHNITFLAAKGSYCPFAKVQIYNPNVALNNQISEDIDVVHLNHQPTQVIEKPYITVMHGNPVFQEVLDINTIFVSEDHAQRHQSSTFVYNGIDTNDYEKPDFNKKRTYLHFLAKASWRIKNVKGAIELARQSKHTLAVLGGNRLNISMGFRFTPYPSIRFYGMVGGAKKSALLNASKGLLFPVLWHEPFGIALIESLYMGCPVFGTPYGSLPEIILPEVGFLSNKKHEIVAQLAHIEQFNPRKCHEYIADSFTIRQSVQKYLGYYQQVLSGKNINLFPPKAIEAFPKFLPFD